jgi:TctA family transporter
VLLAPPLARIAIYFGPFENFALVVMALVLISSLSEGSVLKGLSAGLLGMLVAMPGIDESSGMIRLTFGVTAFEGGFHILPVILGMFALGQVFADALNIEERFEALEASLRGMFISARDYAVHGWNILRSSLIGVWMGILPGVGATIASIVAYTTAKNVSKHPEAFGSGSEEAIIATESANKRYHRGHADPAAHARHPRRAHRLDPARRPGDPQSPAGAAALPQQPGDRERHHGEPSRGACGDVPDDDARHRLRVLPTMRRQ